MVLGTREAGLPNPNGLDCAGLRLHCSTAFETQSCVTTGPQNRTLVEIRPAKTEPPNLQPRKGREGNSLILSTGVGKQGRFTGWKVFLGPSRVASGH